MEAPFLYDFTRELKAPALDDATSIRQALQLSKRRKAKPEWAAPGEVWWLLAHPNSISNFRLRPRGQHGVGCGAPEPLNVSCC